MKLCSNILYLTIVTHSRDFGITCNECNNVHKYLITGKINVYHTSDTSKLCVLKIETIHWDFYQEAICLFISFRDKKCLDSSISNSNVYHCRNIPKWFYDKEVFHLLNSLSGSLVFICWFIPLNENKYQDYIIILCIP